MDCEKKLKILMELGKVISKENNLESLLISLSDIARDIVDGDRASIFIYNPIKDELWTRVAHGVNETIKISVNKGIVGSTLSLKEAQIVKDAYNDPRFFREIDQETGYKTENILTVPMINMKKKVIGVFQVLNKRSGVFSDDDAKMILLLADYAASILENALLYNELESAYKQKTKELEESEERLKIIALTTNDGVWDWNIRTKDIIYSKRFYQMLGFTQKELGFSQENFFLLIHKDDRTLFEESLEKHIASKTEFKCEFRMRSKDGEYKWFICKAHSIWDDDGTHSRMLGANTDISDIKEKENQLKRAYREIENLLKDQDNFIKSAIHEINTPISVINTYLEVLGRDIDNHKYMQRIISATKTLSSVYDDFNFFLNKDKDIYKREYINLSNFTRERCEYFEDISEANNQHIKMDIQENLRVFLSKIELLRVIDNTISNAIKYNKEQKNIFVNLCRDGEDILLSVKDEGRGIEFPEKVFDRYYREKSHKGGFGIGLTVVKTICDKNKIKIQVHSKLDNGTTFKYFFKES